ncbi:hypothetical protein BCR22_03130 [Enterococcus plantarum]|uniref:Uncharacterized protein n=1 Tax=Enterococcus plantarum TaxID=1077675 RepID=A0A2W4BQM1_9ENTE|nr:pectate lyase-like adhesive domain-containing protein [Enterococcus plantarum]MBO0424328.1 hypothetical protein [Enterococcus plantarum]OEG13250.1 hypothetical protein BCR22_03130 [Enterococcus plantarum]PZL75882.1 hypothetical protein CI088_04295 [Enterococcus plantarum]
MNDSSRKIRRKEKQHVEKNRSTQLLKIVLLPLLLLLAIIFLIYGKNKSDDLFLNDTSNEQEDFVVVKEKKYADIYTWEELIAAISNKELTEINIKKDIKFPQSQKQLTLNKLTKVREEQVFRYDDTLKKERKQTILMVSVLKRDLNRKVLISGEKRSIELGNVELDLPKGLDLEFKEIKLIRSYRY